VEISGKLLEPVIGKAGGNIWMCNPPLPPIFLLRVKEIELGFNGCKPSDHCKSVHERCGFVITVHEDDIPGPGLSARQVECTVNIVP
jgi:hypothetical protein